MSVFPVPSDGYLPGVYETDKAGDIHPVYVTDTGERAADYSVTLCFCGHETYTTGEVVKVTACTDNPTHMFQKTLTEY